MKHLLNNLSEQEKSNILAQHKGGIEIGTKNFKKLSESKLGNVKPLITEQSDTEKWAMSQGYSKVNKISLPDGQYILNGSGGICYVYDNQKNNTGYLVLMPYVIRGEWPEQKINISSGIISEDFKDVMFKDIGYKPQAQSTETKKNPEITNKVSTEGIKNVLPEMISGPSFPGTYSGYVFGGTFNGTNYWWDCNGVDGMMGIRGMAEGKIISENNSILNQQTKKEITDADPKGVWVGFYNKTSGSFVIYTTTAGKPKCVSF